MKKLVLSLLLTGCAGSVGTLPPTYIGDPENFYCPVGSFAYCEGRDKVEMECVCIDRSEQRRTLERLASL
tara:strand:- start:223 stop:432 length:210 start_codon:yes stop_codon:yes gene_type:complete